MNHGELVIVLAPEALLVLAAVAAVAVDLLATKRMTLALRLRLAVATGVAGCAAAALAAWHVGTAGEFLAGTMVLDPLARAARVGALALAAGALLLTLGSPEPEHPAEMVALVLLSGVGLLLMAAANHLLLVFVALELASLGLYVLTGLDRRQPGSAEAALKYFLFGGMAAAFLLFGFSLLFGLTGALHLPAVAAALVTQEMTPLLAVALAMVIVAFGFKAAAVPFHLWAPDVYQGAPAPAAAFIASASKLAGLALFFRLFWLGLVPAAGGHWTFAGPPGWLLVVGVLSALSLVLGNLAALAQHRLRRLLAYSAIAHAGVMLLAVMIGGTAGTQPLLYYALSYGIATLGAFGVVGALERAGIGPGLTDLAGLWRRSPLLAACLAIFILSLAGIPPLAGFFGKFFVFAGAFTADPAAPIFWLVALAIVVSAVSLYYYLVVLKHALVAPPPPAAGPVAVPPGAALTLVAAAALVVWMGLLPSQVLALLR